MLHLVDARLPIEPVANDVVGHHELVQLLLQVIILQRQQVCMILQRVQLLLIAVTGLEKGFIALSDGFKFVRQRLQLVITLHEVALRLLNVAIELAGAPALRFFLSDKLALGFSQELIPLVCILAVFL